MRKPSNPLYTFFWFLLYFYKQIIPQNAKLIDNGALGAILDTFFAQILAIQNPHFRHKASVATLPSRI